MGFSETIGLFSHGFLRAYSKYGAALCAYAGLPGHHDYWRLFPTLCFHFFVVVTYDEVVDPGVFGLAGS